MIDFTAPYIPRTARRINTTFIEGHMPLQHPFNEARGPELASPAAGPQDDGSGVVRS